jgi:hypothetical protein
MKTAHIPKFSTIRRVIQDVAWRTADTAVHTFARREQQRFQLRISRQQFESFAAIPLSPQYRARKIAMGRDGRTMIATRHYIESIRTKRTVLEKRDVTYHVGFDKDTRARNLDGSTAQIRLCEVAAVQEYGSAAAHIPARPHWRPHLVDMQQRAVTLRRSLVRQIVKWVTHELRKRLKVR